MSWNVLKNNRIIQAVEPSNVQISEANVTINSSNSNVIANTNHFVVSTKIFLSRLTQSQQNAIKTEAIKQYAAGYVQLWDWWSRIQKGHGIIITNQPRIIAIKNLLLENNILTQSTIDTAFTP